MKYPIILADPPWHFQNYNGAPGEKNPRQDRRGKAGTRSAQSHYATMSLEDIKALPIPAADDAVLLLWACWPLLPEALEVITAWGFEFKTLAWVWVKANPAGMGHYMGLGYWTRANSEPCLLATRGKAIKRQSKNVLSLIYSAVREHSRKPDEQYSKIDRLFGKDLPRLEMFARRAQPGWDVWGNEAPGSIDLQPNSIVE